MFGRGVRLAFGKADGAKRLFRTFAVVLQNLLVNGFGQVAAYHAAPADGADQAFDHRGRDFGDFARRHEENGGDFRFEVAVDVAHGAFVFVVGGGADAAYDELGVDGFGVMNEEAVFKHGDAHVGEFARNGFKHGFALFDAEGAALFGVDADGDDEFVKQGLCFAYHPEVAIGRRVEAAGVNGAAGCGSVHGGTVCVVVAASIRAAARNVKERPSERLFQTAFYFLFKKPEARLVVAGQCGQQVQQAAENVVEGDEDGECRADVAVFAAVDNGTHLPHNHQRTEEDEAGGDGQAQCGDLQGEVGDDGNHQDDCADGQEAAERVHIHGGAACHCGHCEEHGGGHDRSDTDDLRAVAEVQRVLQQRAEQYAHAEGEHHQQGGADVAVTVFLNQENHAVEECHHDNEAHPAAAEHGIKAESHFAADKCAYGRRNE